MDESEHEVMHQLGLDGHWLFTAVLQFVDRCMVDLAAPQQIYNQQMVSFLQFLEDSLHNLVVAGYETQDLDEDHLHRLDAYLEENMDSIMAVTERTIDHVLQIIRQFSAPSYCQHKFLDKYLVGYTTQGDYAGILHFNFVDYEDNNPL